MKSFCSRCWTPRLSKNDINPCKYCIHQPGMTDMYISHPTTCKFGFNDCINDPGYIYVYHPEWYKELYGDKDYVEASKDIENGCTYCTREHCQYDNEDK